MRANDVAGNSCQTLQCGLNWGEYSGHPDSLRTCWAGPYTSP